MIRYVFIIACIAVSIVDADAQPGRHPLRDSTERRESVPFNREVWVHALRQVPSEDEAAFGVTVEAVQYFSVRAHDRWRRNVAAEVLSAPMAWVRLELGYDPESALITGAGGFHAFAEGVTPIANRSGVGIYARYDRAASGDLLIVSDVEFGGQFSFWSDERRVYVNEKLGYRTITYEDNTRLSEPIGDDGSFVQIRHHLVYVPSEDWVLTYVQEATVRVGFGSEPHTDELRFENVFLWSPSLLFSVGPVVGVTLDYFVGPSASILSIPIGGRGELHLSPFVVAVSGVLDVETIAGQRTAGLVLRGSLGYRF